MATTSRRAVAPRFIADDCGVVSIMGLAMAVFLVALLWYEIGIGDAITFKEQLQDATDASGFSAAIYHAKGMNMIVLINLIMALVLAIIVVIRVLEVLCLVVGALATFLCPFTDVTCGAIEPAFQLGGWFSKIADTLDPIVRTALIGLNDVATAVAVGMPWAALVKSGTVGAEYYPQVTKNTGGATLMLSMSLIPDITWIPYLNSANNKLSKAENLGEDPEGMGSEVAGKRWGLPVQEGEFAYLCDQAAQVVPDLFEYAILAGTQNTTNPKVPSWISWFNNAIGALLGTWDTVFCDANYMNTSQAASQTQKMAQDECNNNQSAFSACENEIVNKALPFATDEPVDPCDEKNPGGQTFGDILNKNSKAKFDMSGCITGETNELNEKLSQANNQSQWQSTMNSALPKEMYAYAANGNDYMAIWAFGRGTFSDNATPGVSIAEWLKGGLAKPQSQAATMLTKAEFYYSVENPCGKGVDYGTKGSSALCNTALNQPYWSDYSTDAMWNPRWRARLRRVSPPMIPVGQMLSSGLMSLVGSVLKKGVSEIPTLPSLPNLPPGDKNPSDGAGPGELIEFITGFIQIGGGELDSEIAGQIEKSVGYLH